MGEKLTRRAALACLGSGAVAIGLGSSAFASVQADRTVSVDITGDGNALLGISDQSDSGTVEGPNDSARLFELTDNVGGLTSSDISVELVRVERSDGTAVPNQPLTVEVGSGSQGAFSVTTRCRSTNDSLGDSYRFTVEIVASTSDFSVTAERTTANTVAVTCDSGDITVTDENNNGDKTTGGDVDIEEGVKLKGSVDAGGDVTLNEDARTTGSVTAGGDVDVGEKGKVKGAVDSGGDVTLSQDAQISRSVTADGDVDIGEGAKVKGSVNSGGDVTLSGEKVSGDICADGDITIGENAKVKGSIRSTGGNIDIEQGATVSNDATASGSVSVGEGAKVKGTISENEANVQPCSY